MKATASKVSGEAFNMVKQQMDKVKIEAETDKRITFDSTSAKIVDNVATKAVTPSPKKEEAKVEKVVEKPVENKDAPKEGEEVAWTQDQQQALEKALREFPSSLDPKERWTKIAEKVPGKTKKQCLDRFKELRDAVKSTK
jgi:DnaJ family protein C protein 2